MSYNVLAKITSKQIDYLVNFLCVMIVFGAHMRFVYVFFFWRKPFQRCYFSFFFHWCAAPEKLVPNDSLQENALISQNQWPQPECTFKYLVSLNRSRLHHHVMFYLYIILKRNVRHSFWDFFYDFYDSVLNWVNQNKYACIAHVRVWK